MMVSYIFESNLFEFSIWWWGIYIWCSNYRSEMSVLCPALLVRGSLYQRLLYDYTAYLIQLLQNQCMESVCWAVVEICQSIQFHLSLPWVELGWALWAITALLILLCILFAAISVVVFDWDLKVPGPAVVDPAPLWFKGRAGALVLMPEL